MNKLDKFKAWAVKNKAVIIASAVVVVLAASGVTGTQLYLRTQGIDKASEGETTTEPVDLSAYDITAAPETETTVEQDGDRTIIKDSDGNETVNRTWNEADETVKASGNVNGGGSEIKTDSKGTYTGEQKATAPSKNTSSPKNGDTKVENGTTYRYNNVFGWVEYNPNSPGGCQGDARQSSDEDYNTPAEGIYM